MFLFLLTAREGRLSANHSARRHRCIPQTRHVRILPAPVDLCVSGLAQRTFPDTKPAIVRAFNIGTNDQAEIELSLVSRQCLGSRRIPDLETLQREVKAWNRKANQKRTKINWQFTRKKARKLFQYKKPRSSD